VGAGDAMLAGFVYGIKKKLPYLEMIRWGVACGAANVLSKIPGGIDIRHVRHMMKQVKLEVSPI
jgi:fructose-1-phosphate kinase PfkB-like protein